MAVTAESLVAAFAGAGLEGVEFVAPGVHRSGLVTRAVVVLPEGFTAVDAISRRLEIAAGLGIPEGRLALTPTPSVALPAAVARFSGLVTVEVADEDPGTEGVSG